MTIIVAHRGASGMAPENTMEAYRLGVEVGADAIELDVHLTADGQLAVIHDETLDRTTDRSGRVADLTMDEIREADAGARFTRPDDEGHPFAGQGLRVPTLPEVLEWLPETTGLVIEIKARAAADAVVQAIDGHPAQAGRPHLGHQLRRGRDRSRARARPEHPDRVPRRAGTGDRRGLRLGIGAPGTPMSTRGRATSAPTC